MHALCEKTRYSPVIKKLTHACTIKMLALYYVWKWPKYSSKLILFLFLNVNLINNESKLHYLNISTGRWRKGHRNKNGKVEKEKKEDGMQHTKEVVKRNVTTNFIIINFLLFCLNIETNLLELDRPIKKLGGTNLLWKKQQA